MDADPPARGLKIGRPNTDLRREHEGLVNLTHCRVLPHRLRRGSFRADGAEGPAGCTRRRCPKSLVSGRMFPPPRHMIERPPSLLVQAYQGIECSMSPIARRSFELYRCPEGITDDICRPPDRYQLGVGQDALARHIFRRRSQALHRRVLEVARDAPSEKVRASLKVCQASLGTVFARSSVTRAVSPCVISSSRLCLRRSAKCRPKQRLIWYWSSASAWARGPRRIAPGQKKTLGHPEPRPESRAAPAPFCGLLRG